MYEVSITDGTVFYKGDDRNAAQDIYNRVVAAFNDGCDHHMHVFLTGKNNSVLLRSQKI